ncbi:hypothetical protein [Roseibium alexandrii]|uniref:hypothetical protein n=1 Tax=Roseibium alexandrii TaxID=388408 RepID=UPI003753E12F
MLRALAILALTFTQAMADEPSNNLGTTRSAFLDSFAETYPDLELPALECGSANLMRFCQSPEWHGITMRAADIHTSDSRIAVFVAGSEGRLYSLSLEADLTADEKSIQTFGAYCTAIFERMNPGWDLASADKMLETMLQTATKEGEVYLVDESAVYAVRLSSGSKGSCKITAEHTLPDGRTVTN